MPCFDDWSSAGELLAQLNGIAGHFQSMRVYIVDDGSVTHPPDGFLASNYEGIDVELVRLQTNLGHQRALCIGLVRSLSDTEMTYFVLMDGDGEDKASDIPALIDSLIASEADAAVATRRKRYAGSTFRLFNRLFQALFRILTGRTLNFGNFMALTDATARRLANTPDAWNNLPTTLMRSRAQILRVPLDRGQRFEGQSRLGLTGLVNHGLGAVAVYSDVVFTRVILGSSAALGASVLVGITALITRILTGSPLPGWFALGTTAVAVGSLVLLVLVTSLTFIMLGNRRSVTPPLAVMVQPYIATTTSLPISLGRSSGSLSPHFPYG